MPILTKLNFILLAIGAALGFSLGYAVKGVQKVEKPINESIVVQQAYTVSRVIDGDTVDIDPGIEVLSSRIRLLGIDTPERSQPFYREAGESLEGLIRGKQIFLESDQSNADRYGRLLRYIIIDNKNINVEMVRLGYAKAYMYKGLKYESKILFAEEDARMNKRGIWDR